MTGIVAVVLGGITFAVGLLILLVGLFVMLKNLLMPSLTVAGATDSGTGGGTGGNANTKGSTFWDFAMKFLDYFYKAWKLKAQEGFILMIVGIFVMYVGASTATGMGLVTLPF